MRFQNKSLITPVAIFLVLTLSSILIISCDRRSNIYSKIADAETLISDDPDSALHILEDLHFRELSGMDEKQKAYLCIALAKSKLRLGKSFITDETFDQSIHYLESVADTVGLIDIYQLAAIKKRWFRQQDSAAYYLSKAIALTDDSSAKIRSALYIKLSNLYAFPTLNKDYQSAIKYAKLALSSASTSEDSARAYHDIGLFYSFQNQNDSAIMYMRNAINGTVAEHPDLDTYILNYANTDPELSRSVSFLNLINGKSLGKFITLGFLYLNNSRPDSAIYYLVKSKKLYNENPSSYSINTYNNLRLLEQSINLLKTGVVSQGDGTIINDSISQTLEIQRKISEERHYYNNQLQIRLLESRARRQLIGIVSLVILIIFIMSFGLYVWYSKRRFLKLKQQLDNVRIEQIVTEASESVNNLGESQKLLKERIDICREQFRLTKLQVELDKMELQYRNTDSYPPLKNREALQKRLIECFAELIVDLKMTGAKLNLDDIVTCSMSCLNESNAAIAACLGTTETAVRTRKTRLRAKLPTDVWEMIGL